MKPLDRYKALIAEAFGASEKLDSVDIDDVLQQAHSAARTAVETQQLSGASAQQVRAASGVGTSTPAHLSFSDAF